MRHQCTTTISCDGVNLSINGSIYGLTDRSGSSLVNKPHVMSRNLEIQTKYEAKVKELRSLLNREEQNTFDDDILLRALLARDMGLTSARHLLQKYTTARKDQPALFTTASNQRLAGVYETAISFHPTFQTAQGCHLFYAKALEWDPAVHPLDVLLQAIVLSVEYASLDYAVQEKGFILLIDTQDIGWKYVWAIKPAQIYAFGQLITHYLPTHLKNVIVINTNWALDAIWKVVKPVLPAELVRKVVMCGSDAQKAAFFLTPAALADASYIPTPEMRSAYARDLKAHDHVVQSLRSRYLI